MINHSMRLPDIDVQFVYTLNDGVNLTQSRNAGISIEVKNYFSSFPNFNGFFGDKTNAN